MEPGKRSRSVMLPVIFLVAALTFQACGSNDNDRMTPTVEGRPATGTPRFEATFGDDGGQDMSFDEFVAKRKAALHEYQWPPKYTPDLDAIVAISPQTAKEMRFQAGMEYSSLGVLNVCAWALSWADAYKHNDSQGEARALDAMREILPKAPGNGDPSVQQGLTEMADKAALGDPSVVNGVIAANACATLPWLASS